MIVLAGLMRAGVTALPVAGTGMAGTTGAPGVPAGRGAKRLVGRRPSIKTELDAPAVPAALMTGGIRLGAGVCAIEGAGAVVEDAMNVAGLRVGSSNF